MMTTRISIILPVYNVELYVERCLRSVVEQTYNGPIECLIVDDHGKDRSMEVVCRFISNYHGTVLFRVLHHDHNRGLSAARNTGMEAATGDYIYFLDSDDEITADCIEKLVAPLSDEHYDLVVGNVQTIGNEKLNALLDLKLSDGEILCGKEIEETYRLKWNMMAQNKLYRAVFIRDNDLCFKEGLVNEDELWSLQVACLAKTLRAVKHLTYNYYVRENSLTTVADAKMRRCKMLKIVVAEICKFLKERQIFSVRAYQLVNKFFWESLSPVLHSQNLFIQEYCHLRKAVCIPLSYRIKAVGFHPRAQIGNLYYFMPSRIAARILYWRLNN